MEEQMIKRFAIGLMLLLPFSGFAQPDSRVEEFDWLAGCWESRSDRGVYHEIWMKPEGGSQLGVSRNIRAGKTVDFEFIRLVEEGGVVYYIAKPANQAEVKFKLVRLEDKYAIFENPDHDFPQRIIYQQKEDGSLHARIEGTRNGKERGIDFPMKRVACE